MEEPALRVDTARAGAKGVTARTGNQPTPIRVFATKQEKEPARSAPRATPAFLPTSPLFGATEVLDKPEAAQDVPAGETEPRSREWNFGKWSWQVWLRRSFWP